MKQRKSLINTALSIGLICSASTAIASNTVVVTNNSDDGSANTFRWAIEQANSDPSVTSIIFDIEDTVEITSTVIYTGSQELSIVGNNSKIDGTLATEGDLFVAQTSAPLVIDNITFQNSNGRCVVVEVPTSATDDVSFFMKNSAITGCGLYGLHIDDNSNLEDDAGTGADAGIIMVLRNSTFTNSGIGALDYDGVRVDERGNGSITATIADTIINANGGDGIELDEGGSGDVSLTMTNTTINDNGFFNEEDLDDGLDIDEADDGSIYANIVGVTANNNLDEGIDLDEAGNGNAIVSFTNVTADGNKDESIKVDEEDNGDIKAIFVNTTVKNSGDDGIQIEELGAGRLYVFGEQVTLTDNAKYGVKLGQYSTEDTTEASPGWVSGTASGEGNAKGLIKVTGAVIR